MFALVFWLYVAVHFNVLARFGQCTSDLVVLFTLCCWQIGNSMIFSRDVPDSNFPNPRGPKPDLRINVKQHQSQNESNESLNIK